MVNVPPLLCSTPPPIDFGDEEDDRDSISDSHNRLTLEDDYGSFLSVSDNINEPLPSPRPPSISNLHDAESLNAGTTCIAPSSPPPLELIKKSQNNPKNEAPPPHLTEAFNYNIKNKSSSREQLFSEMNIQIEIPRRHKEEFVSNTSLLNVPFQGVLIEDVEDDDSEDELYRPKMAKNFPENDTNSNHYFGIENVNEVVAISTDWCNNNLKSIDNEIANTSTADHHNQLQKCNEAQMVKGASKGMHDESKCLESFEITENKVPYNHTKDDVDGDDEFGDFSTFQQDNTSQSKESHNTEYFSQDIHESSVKPIETTEKSKHYMNKTLFDSNDANISNLTQQTPSVGVVTSDAGNDKVDIDNEDDDEDEFGDFNTAQPSPITSTTHTNTLATSNVTASTLNQSKTSHNYVGLPAVAAATTTTTIQPNTNLNDRISKILDVMFPKDPSAPLSEKISSYATEPFRRHKLNDIPFTTIDAAKALEFQWTNSQSRQIFIKSLGIDSRNILFGENWNPALPRYAANLSFNPLMPMKPEILSPSHAEVLNDRNGNVNTLGNRSVKDSEEVELKSVGEHNGDVLKENSKLSDASVDVTSLPCVVQENLGTADNYNQPLELEDKFSTPNELEPVTVCSSQASPCSTTEQILHNLDSLEMPEFVETSASGVVVSSTFSGPLKETHIYTPSKSSDTENSKNAMSPSRVVPVDFDYKKAAMGVIIDETVVKKEYRDIVYEPEFTNDVTVMKVEDGTLEEDNCTGRAVDRTDIVEDDDEFSDFQCVPNTKISEYLGVSDSKVLEKSTATTAEAHAPNTPKSVHGMILSPAILLPQAIPLDMQKTQIEWGDSTANINPDELARIEELFPEPKSLKSSVSSSSQKSTPTHVASPSSSLSISAAIAHREQQATNGEDDEDWSEFVSVPANNINNQIQNPSINNNHYSNHSPYRSGVATPPTNTTSAFSSKGQNIKEAKDPKVNQNTFTGDDEWSDFVSSTVPTSAAPNYKSAAPQFNSAAWQNANFYNNPLSLYHRGPLNLAHATACSPIHLTTHLNNNNNNNNNYSVATSYTRYHSTCQPQHSQQQQQQVHIMQNFSTAPVPTPERSVVTASMARNTQLQMGSAKVAPSIALIPDLGFMAPAIPTHTSFINSLPRPSLNTKK